MTWRRVRLIIFFNKIRNLFYQLPIFIIVNNQFLNPATNIDTYNLLLKVFSNILYQNPNQYFQVYSIYSQVFYRTALAFKFYFNQIIPNNLNNLINNYIKQSFESTNLGILFCIIYKDYII